MLRPSSLFWWLAVTAVLIAAPQVQAGVIAITTSVQAKVEDDKLYIIIQVENTGDEGGYNLQAKVLTLGREVETRKVSDFLPGKPSRFSINMPVTDVAPGTYPVIVRVFCTDANQYPFSALASHVFTKGAEGAPVEVIASMKPLSLADAGNLKLDLKNMSEDGITASIRVYSPRELTLAEDWTKLMLPGRSEKNLEYGIKNFSARPTSSYPVLATVEYDDDGVHQTTVAMGMVTIVEPRKIFGLNYYVIGGGLALLIVVFIAVERFRK